MSDFQPCQDCGMRSACKTGHACTIKRREREAKLLECAARELCRMDRLDPDDRPYAQTGDSAMNWEYAADEITRHNQIADAIAHALRTNS